ncbi:MAG TPA: TatD family hydrolase, partial [Flavobacteriales bacterium]|nr:TatD family hydrolase [Flavobacteriales bacterium]
MFIDTHAHLYHKQFDDDRADMVQRALDAGVTTLHLPNIDGESIGAMHAMVEAYP